MSAAVLGRLLRAPSDIAASCREDRDTRAIALASLGAVALGSAVFGAVIGSFRGQEQILYAAIKVPLAMLITLALSAPAFHALAAVLGRPWLMRSVVALVLASAGRSSLVLLAFAPVLWLLIDLGLGYHASSVAAWLAYAVAGLAALGVLVRGIGAGPGRALTALAFVAVFFAVGGQAAWILRPYLGRPSEKTVPFLRAREGSFSDALVRSFRSSLGIYDRTAPHRSPGVEQRSPDVEPRSSGVEHRTPGVEHRSPGAEHRTPGAEHRSPGAEHRTPDVEADERRDDAAAPGRPLEGSR